MSKIILYIAASLDGKIARKDGNLDWLMNLADPDQTDYGYEQFLSGIGTVIMGRKTYDEILSYGVEWPYPGITTYLVSTNPGLQVNTPDTRIIISGLSGMVQELRNMPGKDVWLIGGGQLISWFLNHNLLDHMILTIIPVILGEGIELFPGSPAESHWKLIRTKAYNSGVVSLEYEIISPQATHDRIIYDG